MRTFPATLVVLLSSWAWAQDKPPQHSVPGRISSRVLARQIEGESTDEQIKIYEKLLQSNPTNGFYQTGLVSTYLEKVRESADFSYLDRASAIVQRMLERDAANFAALRYQNEIDLQRHDFKTVATRAEVMVKDAPSDPGSWANLGDASMELGDYDRAGQAYLKMFALGPSLGSYNRLAYWRFVMGDSESAIRFMRQAIDAGDRRPETEAWCWAELGDIYFKVGQVEEAEAAYNAALHLFPRLHRALAGLGKAQASRGQTQPAIRSYERAQSIVPMVDYAGALEDLYSASGLRQKAAEQRDLLATIEMLGNATNEKTNRNLALVLADHNRDLKAALALVEAELPNRGDVYTWDALSWVLFKNGRLTEASEASAKALRLKTPEPLFYYHAAQIASAAGDENARLLFANRLMSLNARFDFAKAGTSSNAIR